MLQGIVYEYFVTNEKDLLYYKCYDSIMSDELNLVGKHNKRINDILGLNLDELDIFRSSGLIAHLLKRKHYSAIKYLDKIPDIIQNPDYVGINPNENGVSYELVKQIKDHFVLGIKLESNGKYLFVSTFHRIAEKDVNKQLNSGRLKNYIDNSTEND